MEVEFFNRKLKKNYVEFNKFLNCDETQISIINKISRFVNHKSYSSLFGDQWKRYKKTQLDSYSGTQISTTRMERLLGEKLSDLTGKYVLEEGCGAGRFKEVFLNKGANLISSDLSTAVEVNLENFPVSEKHVVIQAVINDMPFKNNTFDVVICIGVLQHTPSPKKSIKDLFDLLKVGGTLIIDHYTFSKSNYLRTAPLYRKYLKKLSLNKTLKFTEKLVRRYLPLHKALKGKKIFSVILNRVSPVISYYNSLRQLNDQMQEEWAMLDTYDSLTDWHKHFRSKKEITKLFLELKAKDIWCEYGGNGVEARCKKA